MLEEILSSLPSTDDKVIVTHSGGLDSSTAVILAVHKYGAENVISVGFDYGQKQVIELTKAQELCDILGVQRNVLDLRMLGDIASTVSSNIQGSAIEMPGVEVGTKPVTEIPFRNMIMFAITAAFAEVNKASHIICGLQVHDVYGYWDTSQEFVDKVNSVFHLNENKVTLLAPFSHLSKAQELNILQELDKIHLMKHTLTCYNPDSEGRSCGKCPSCFERIRAFEEVKLQDLIEYQ